MVFLKQLGISGKYDVNGVYFSYCILSSLRMEMNGNTFASMFSSFPNNIANLFYHTLSNLKDDEKFVESSVIQKGAYDTLVGFTHVGL